MVTSRIPTYSLNTEFNREFRSFRVSSTSNSHIVPVHEFSRISLQERRAALRAAFAKDNAPDRFKPSEGKTLFLRCDTLQERRAALEAAFEKNATEKSRFEIKTPKKQQDTRTESKDDKFSRREYNNILSNKYESKDKIFAKVDTVVETRGDIRMDDRNGAVLSIRSNFKKFPLRESKPEVRSLFTDRLIGKFDNKCESKYQIIDRRAILATESLTDIRTDLNKEYGKLPKIDYKTISGAESLKNIFSDLKEEVRKRNKRPEYSKLSYIGSVNDVRTQSRIEDGKLVKTRVLTTEDPKREGWATPDSGVALGDSPPEERPGKGSDLPTMYLSLASWTPKSSVFQNRLKEHEWSISYVPNGF